MIARTPRVAYFPDSFHEAERGGAHQRHFEAFAGAESAFSLRSRGRVRRPSLRTATCGRWSCHAASLLCARKDLRFDLAFLRHIPLIGEVLERFQAYLIHITGPARWGCWAQGWLITWAALAASWHTNVHEYLARRSGWLLNCC